MPRAVRAFVLGTGSSGNSLLVEAEGVRVLVDAGLGPQVLERRLAALGVALAPHGIDAIIPTHHHGDHFAGVEKIARAHGCPVYLHAGIDAPRLRARHRDVRTFAMGRPFRVGSLEVLTQHVPHDAPQVAVRVASADHAIGYATDVGRITNDLTGLLASCDVALVEANHCTEMLAYGPYPTHLKARVGGGLGHLSNAQTAELASRLSGSRVGRLYLGHLSQSNNTPERALETVARGARRIAVEVLSHGAVCALDVRRARSFQLALPFG
ncbi:MAG: Metal-dependent hydrolase of the beta-lactamase superfamily [Labilithrix sp.]|nr:Metal-dependent hydrolase of the beta-lactamase superfamily [Labilithrix sp.]